METQSSLGMILEESSRLHRASIVSYGKANRKAYLGAARNLERGLAGKDRETKIRKRVAFAILSANCPFDSSVQALAYTHDVGLGNVTEEGLARFQCVPFKAKACRELALRPIKELLRGHETWQDYRERLKATTPGLGRAKASFAASLLYPMTADLACIDTWICKVFLGEPAFKSLSRVAYESVESEIRKLRDAIGFPSTFLSQWCAWDSARGGKVNSHDIFPSQNKDSLPTPF